MADQAIYHERQTLYRCGLHALNNVLQGTTYLPTLRHSKTEVNPERPMHLKTNQILTK